ncbi:c-type cytochrome [Myxococcus sp. Y35]|uniref:c-type cytochrome n=1 Tax=Pseudomyxococcus flavus TaxID=3115648 RepID=UPI003CFB37A4
MSARLRSAAVVALALAACVDEDPMQVQPRDNAYSADPKFADGRAMRPPVPGTVPQEWYRRQAPYVPAEVPDGGLVDPARFPLTLTRELLLRGRGHFETWCAPCHGLTGDGQSIVGENMQLRAPPALYGPHHAVHPARGAVNADGGVADAGGEGEGPLPPGWEALPHPPGFYYQVITEGYGLMPSYAAELPPEERWAVVAWLRVLAYSQRAPLSDAPPDIQSSLQQQTGSGGVP